MMPELSTSRLLTMEYCPGVKITDSERLAEMNVHTAELSSLLTTSYLEQICRHGFFHCDPHPGNLAVDNGHPGGRHPPPLALGTHPISHRAPPHRAKGSALEGHGAASVARA